MKQKKSESNTCNIVFLISGLFVSIFFISLLAGVYGIIFNALFHAKYQVKPGSETEEIWIKTPVPLVMKVYIFNITNPDDFLKGNKPELNELGPYIYREHRSKENLTYHPNMTVTYYQKRWWYWDEETSHGSLDDLVTSINTIPVSAAFSIENSPILSFGLNRAFETLDESAIVKATASQILFDGYEDPILNLMNATNKFIFSFPFPEGLKNYDKFAWFYKRNNSMTFDGIYNMYTGQSGLGEVGLIDWWNYSNKTEYFESPCNGVNGSAGELWPPGIGRDFIQFYNSDLCMSPKLYYSRDIEDSFGNPGYRFVGSKLTFANQTFVPENKCFCVKGNCAPTGLLNSQSCRMGAPSFVSFPHFYNADPELLKNVEGLNPVPKKHEFYIDINPDLGMPLRVAARIQINLWVKPYPGEGFGHVGKIRILESVPDVILPIIWFEVLTEMTPELNKQMSPVMFFISSGPVIIFSLMTLIGIFLVVTFSYKMFRK